MLVGYCLEERRATRLGAAKNQAHFSGFQKPRVSEERYDVNKTGLKLIGWFASPMDNRMCWKGRGESGGEEGRYKTP